MEGNSDIAAWYSGKAVFITGATGFMGKVLVEKLLRSCPGVGPIYILVRKKRGSEPQERVRELLASRLFDDLRSRNVELNGRVYPIHGDISEADLAISADDRKLLTDTVSVVFHVAATLKMDEGLRLAVAMNLGGTKALLQLCREMINLNAVVHVSTAYAYTDLPIIEERVYPPPADPEKITQCVASLDDDTLKFLTPRLLGNLPNTYVFTKAMAEQVVKENAAELPIVIVRPSIVCASWKDPQAGWVDSVNGPVACITGAGKGLYRVLFCHKEMMVDMIPVDVCINMFIAAAWDMGKGTNRNHGSDIPVYNCVSSPWKPMSWQTFMSEINSMMQSHTFCDVLMNPRVILTTNRYNFIFAKKFYEAIPAYVGDFLVWMTGGKPLFRRVQNRLYRTSMVLEYFMIHEWEFRGDNVERLNSRLSSVDREVFDFDMKRMNWKEYIDSYYLGIRKHVLKENEDTIPRARRRLLRVKLLTAAFKIGTVVAITYSAMAYFDVTFKDVNSFVPEYLKSIIPGWPPVQTAIR